MRSPGCAAVGLWCWVVVGSAPIAAQLSPQFTAVGAAGLYTSLGGDDFEAIDDGFGGEGSLWFRMGGSWLIGGGVTYTHHDVDFVDTSVGILGIFAEPRYLLVEHGRTLSPYVAARLAWVRQSGTSAGTDVSANGFLLGGGGGLVARLGARVDLDLEVLLSTISFGNFVVGGSTIQDSGTNGSALTGRVGIMLRLGE